MKRATRHRRKGKAHRGWWLKQPSTMAQLQSRRDHRTRKRRTRAAQAARNRKRLQRWPTLKLMLRPRPTTRRPWEGASLAAADWTHRGVSYRLPEPIMGVPPQTTNRG